MKLREQITNALLDIIDGAPLEQRDRLASALERYQQTYSRTWREMTDGRKLISDLLDVMVEGSDARVPGNNPEEDR